MKNSKIKNLLFLFTLIFSNYCIAYRQDHLAKVIRGDNDLSWLDLKNADLRQYDLSGKNLKGSDLRGANLSGMTLLDVDFMWADLRNSDLKKTTIQRVDFELADLRNIKFCESKIEDTFFFDAKMQKSNFTNSELKDNNYSGANLTKSIFNGVDLECIQEIFDSSAKVEGITFDAFFIEFVEFLDEFSEVDSEEESLDFFNLDQEDFAKIKPSKISDFQNPEMNFPSEMIFEKECYICRDVYEDNSLVAVLPCGHIFCKDCADTSLSYKDEETGKLSCPTCREEAAIYLAE